MAYADDMAEIERERAATLAFSKAFRDFVFLELNVESNPCSDIRFGDNRTRLVFGARPADWIGSVCGNPACEGRQLNLIEICRLAGDQPATLPRVNRIVGEFRYKLQHVSQHTINLDIQCAGWEKSVDGLGRQGDKCPNTLRIKGAVLFSGPYVSGAQVDLQRSSPETRPTKTSSF